jgi:quinol monooxygenase YgiN
MQTDLDLEAERHMIRLHVELGAPSSRGAQDLLDAVRFLAVSTRLEDGCLGCSTWVDPDGSVHYVEEWASEPDVRRHVRSDRFTSLLAVVESSKEPRVHFDFITASRGLDYVAEVRGDGA